MKLFNNKLNTALTLLFLAASCVLYYFILTAGGTLLVATSYASIILCFAFALAGWQNFWIIGGLACTVGADFFLVVCETPSSNSGVWSSSWAPRAYTLQCCIIPDPTKPSCSSAWV